MVYLYSTLSLHPRRRRRSEMIRPLRFLTKMPCCPLNDHNFVRVSSDHPPYVLRSHTFPAACIFTAPDTFSLQANQSVRGWICGVDFSLPIRRENAIKLGTKIIFILSSTYIPLGITRRRPLHGEHELNT